MYKRIVFSSLVLTILSSCQNYGSSGLELEYIDGYQSSSQFSSTNADCIRELDTLSNGIVVEVTDTAYILEGDILLSDLNIEAISSPVGRGAIRTDQAQFYWPGRVVGYEFNVNFTLDYRDTALAVMNDISRMTGIRFTPVNSDTRNSIHFCYHSSANNSYVGMQGGSQIINIHSNYYRVIAHETLHSLGLFHEHSRSDRDDYITINQANIRPDYQYAFRKYTESGYTGYNVGPFDYNSVMLYDGYITDPLFVYNDNIKTIVRNDTGGATVQGSSLSDGDIAAIRSIYGPPYHRLEDVQVELLEDTSDYCEETYRERRNATIYFYEDEACTIPSSLQYPRMIRIKTELYDCTSYGEMRNRTTTQTIVVPAGASSYSLGEYENYENYLYSTPNLVHRRTYSIVNYHVRGLYEY